VYTGAEGGEQKEVMAGERTTVDILADSQPGYYWCVLCVPTPPPTHTPLTMGAAFCLRLGCRMCVHRVYTRRVALTTRVLVLCLTQARGWGEYPCAPSGACPKAPGLEGFIFIGHAS
jgi:hypothetical protein